MCAAAVPIANATMLVSRSMLVQAISSVAASGAAAAACDSNGGNVRIADVMGSAQSRQRRCRQKAARQPPAAQALVGQNDADKPDPLVALVEQGKQPVTGTAESNHGDAVPQVPRQQAARQQVSCSGWFNHVAAWCTVSMTLLCMHCLSMSKVVAVMCITGRCWISSYTASCSLTTLADVAVGKSRGAVGGCRASHCMRARHSLTDT